MLIMDAEGIKFGRGPRELTGSVDLLNLYKLWPHHNFFCKRTLPSSISGTHYLHNVVGDTEIRKGNGMELDQLFHNTSYVQSMNSSIRPFDLDALRQAFQLREAEPIELPAAEKGIPTSDAKSTADSKDKKHKDRDKEKDREHKKHKHHRKDRIKDKVRDKSKKDESGSPENGDDHSKRHHEKKRKITENGDATDSHKHKKRKHKDEKN